MGSQYRSSLESMIHYVLAAPGAGKSAVAPHLRAFLPGSVILDWDAFMGPAQALAGVAIRQAPQTWASYEQLVRTIVDQVWPVSTLMLKRVHTPAAERLAKWRMAPPCADDERRTRLAPRRNPTQMEEAVADAASDDAGHPLHPQRQPPAPGPPTPGDARRHEGPKASSQQATTAEGGFMPHGRPPTPVEALQLAQATLETWLARWPRPK
jgi:hypothetical protein